MKVILEVQHAVGKEHLRGYGYYALHLTQELLKRKAFDYELTFFDYGREMGSYKRVRKHFGVYNVPVHECNTLDYRTAIRDRSVYDTNSYNEYTGAYGDLFHFMNILTIPANLTGKMVVTVHDLNVNAYPEFCDQNFYPLAKEGLDRLNAVKPYVIVISEHSGRQVLELTDIPEDRIFKVHHTCDTGELYYQEDVNRERLTQLGISGDYLLFISALNRHKNIKRIVEAFDCIAGKYPGLQLVLAGKDFFESLSYVQDAVESSKYKDRIVMPGYVDAETKRILLSNALCFVFPSLMEGFGFPPLEAMLCGCPVITSNTTSLPEVTGDAAILVDPLDVEQLAFEMERVIMSDSLRADMRAKGFEQSKKFSVETMAKETEDVYRHILSL